MKTWTLISILMLSLAGDTRGKEPAMHAIAVRVALVTDEDGRHVTFRTQNGGTVSLDRSDLVGKNVLVATTREGEPITNVKPIDATSVTLGPDLTARFTTPAHYADGAWEVACVIQLTPPGKQLPAPGDLAAFDLTPPRAGEDPLTGVSVRVHVKGSDGSVTLGNRYFVRFAG